MIVEHVSKIRMKYGQILVFLFFLSSQSALTQDQVALPDSITVVWHGGSMVYGHIVAPGETLYSLCRKFHTSIDQVYQFNPAMEGSLLSVGQRIWIPTDRLLSKEPPSAPVISVYYVVQPGETLFRIARVFLKQDVAELMARNGLSDYQIKPGQRLIIGWLPGAMQSTDAQLLQGSDSTLAHTSTGSFPHSELPALGPDTTAREIHERILKVKHTAGVAFQIQTTGGQKKYFALHNTAEPNSYIEITNPMFNTRVLAKVIGKIPKGVYPNDIEIIVSPAVARDLRVLDRRFYVQLKYLY